MSVSIFWTPSCTEEALSTLVFAKPGATKAVTRRMMMIKTTTPEIAAISGVLDFLGALGCP